MNLNTPGGLTLSFCLWSKTICNTNCSLRMFNQPSNDSRAS